VPIMPDAICYPNNFLLSGQLYEGLAACSLCVPDLLCYYELTATEGFVCLLVSRGSSVNRRGSVESDLVTFSCSCRFTRYLATFVLMGKRCFYYVILLEIGP
jgi:hypothetical protein